MSHQKIAPTFQLRLFGDSDLRKGGHDAIMQWAESFIRSHPDHLEAFVSPPVLTSIFDDLWLKERGTTCRWVNDPFGSDYRKSYRDFFVAAARQVLGEPPVSSPVTAPKIVWEHPLYASSESRRQIGYVDLRVTLRYMRPVGVTLVSADATAGGKFGSVLHEVNGRLLRSGGSIGIRNGQVEDLGWRTSSLYPPDQQQSDKEWIRTSSDSLSRETGGTAILDGRMLYRLESTQWKFEAVEKYAYLEVKTEVPSIGELIRQLRFYQAYGCRPLIVIAPPDDQLSEILDAQGFGFLAYSHNGI